MKRHSKLFREKGSTLLVVLLLGTISAFILAGTMRWTAGTSRINDRAIRHSVSIAAAEAATEKVLAEMGADFARQGAGIVSGRLPFYRGLVPNSSESSHWNRYRFSDGQGNTDAVQVEMTSAWTDGAPLISQYEGLRGYAANFRIKADATDVAASHELTGAVQQDVQLALIPVFQFAIFYNVDLEINPGAPMTVGGRTHGNKNVYLQPGSTLTFEGDVTGSDNILPDKKPGDPSVRSGGTLRFNGEHDSGVATLNLPIGTANTPEAVREIVEIPPDDEPVSSPLGRQRFYNSADLVILVTDSGVEIRGGGTGNGNGLDLSNTAATNFVTTTRSFRDAREQKTVKVTQIDVGAFVAWNASTNNSLRYLLNRDLHSIYVADLRTQAADSIPGIRLVNGAQLPPLGLTVATPDPLYIQGHYNATGAAIGGNNTANTKPAALVADSINILSGSWNDANSTAPLSSRNASSTTVNAAFLAGIVQTGGGYYSGGVENFPRFLENWSGDIFTYNGSMVVLFESQHAKSPWKGTGSTYNIYNPPNRNWYFDTNFLSPTKLPPLCPSVRAFIRGQWAMVAPNS